VIGTRYEEYTLADNGLPFVLHVDLQRSPYLRSREQNWHEDIEIQLCTDGQGWVLLDGERYPFAKGDVAVVNSNVLHYTGTDDSLRYTCLIVRAGFCRQMGIAYDALQFSALVCDPEIVQLLCDLVDVYRAGDTFCRTARLNDLTLRLLIRLTERHAVSSNTPSVSARSRSTVKQAVRYIRENADRRLLLDEIARSVCADKFSLCRAFKQFTGYTLVEYSSLCRCQRAADFLADGRAVSEAAALCGYDNLSFFTKTFKRYMGALPSDYKHR
jgi:AraC-like DNA-binding protein